MLRDTPHPTANREPRGTAGLCQGSGARPGTPASAPGLPSLSLHRAYALAGASLRGETASLPSHVAKLASGDSATLTRAREPPRAQLPPSVSSIPGGVPHSGP